MGGVGGGGEGGSVGWDYGLGLGLGLGMCGGKSRADGRCRRLFVFGFCCCFVLFEGEGGFQVGLIVGLVVGRMGMVEPVVGSLVVGGQDRVPVGPCASPCTSSRPCRPRCAAPGVC